MNFGTNRPEQIIRSSGRISGIAIAFLIALSQSGSAQTGATTERSGTASLLDVRQWDRAESAGWKRSGDGTGFQADAVRLQSAGAERSGAEVSFPHSIAVPERFAISFRARFLKLGLEDDGTEKKSNLRLSIGVKTAKGDFGVGFLFTGDRYKVDTQYKVTRTDTAWHDWRFEVDTNRKTVAMYRDGAYVCLHQAGSRQPEGVRILARGTKTLPAEVEFARFALEPLTASPVSVARASRRTYEIGPGEWPLWRRDPQNTGLSPLKGSIKKPRIVWQQPAGTIAPQPVFLDLDADGTKETLISHGGNLTAYRLNGQQVWSLREDNATVFGIYDLDGDGTGELVFASGFPTLFRVADARTGKVRYTCTRYPMAGVAGARIAKINPKKKGLQAVIWSPQHELGFCLSFENGIESAVVSYEFNWIMTNFSPGVALADMNRDDTLDVIVNTYDWTFVFDGGTGKRRMALQWPAGRNYGTLVVQDVDGDGYPDVVALSDFLREHLAVLKNEQGKSLRLLWDNFYEQNYPDDFKTLRTVAESVADFDGDGKTEIAASLFDSTTDSTWRTFLLDALTGKVKQEIAGCYLVGAGTPLPGKPPVLLLSRPADRSELNLNHVALWAFESGQWKEQEKLPEGTVLPAATIRDFALNTWTTTLINTTVFRPLSKARPELGLFLSQTDTTGQQAISFLAGDSTGHLASRWTSGMKAKTAPRVAELSGEITRARRFGPGEQIAGRVTDVAEILPDSKEPQVIAAGTDGSLRIYGADSEVLGSIQPRTGFITMPVSARLRKGELPSLLYMNADGELVCLRAEAEGKAPRVCWTQPAVGFRPRMVTYLDGQGVPVIADVNGDGEREILVARKPNELVALDADGKVTKTWTLPGLPTQWMVGQFDDSPEPDLFVSWPSGAHVDMESGVISGKDGTLLWKSKCGNGPMAIFDFNGDGRDDILLRDLFERRTLDATTGRDLYPITMWAGYHTPVLLPLSGAKQPPGVAWIGGMYSLVAEGVIGKQNWWKPYRATGPQAVADVDNNGRYEIGGVTAGQLYNWPKFYAVDGPDKEFLCCDALTGKVQWSYPIGTTASGVIAADVDGDGNREFLLGTMDGRLMALRGGANENSRVLWEMSFPAAVGPPIVCDVNGDGVMSILVGCADGNLYCVR